MYNDIFLICILNLRMKYFHIFRNDSSQLTPLYIILLSFLHFDLYVCLYELKTFIYKSQRTEGDF